MDPNPLVSWISSLAGAGWPGVVAMLLGGFGLFYGFKAISRWMNRAVDERDLAHAGANSGEVAADLAAQAREITQKLEELQKKDPPSKPSV